MPYRKVFRYDPLNIKLTYYIAVPLCKENLFQQIEKLNQEVDHMRLYVLSKRQQCQIKCVLNESLLNNDFIYGNSFVIRYYSSKVNNKFIKIDANINNTSRQDIRGTVIENLRNLNHLKEEILSESVNLAPLLIKSINKGIWPMLICNKEVLSLVKKRQQYLAMLSNKYGFRSITVIQQVTEWLTKLDLRVFAIQSVYKSQGNLIPGVDGLVLKLENLFDYLESLNHKNLKYYKADPIRKVYISKQKDPFLGILTIKDRIVQTLFVQILEPIIDVHADNYSFGFRKGRHPHQAVGVLSKLLSVEPLYQKYFTNKIDFTNIQYILNINLKNFCNIINKV